MMTAKKIYCLTPVYNDWESFQVLLNHIEKIQSENTEKFLFTIVAVNDGSSDECLPEIKNTSLSITIINLKINIGHQRAIAVGLQYIYNEVSDYDFVIVMDSDGEDKPEDIIKLIQKNRYANIFKNNHGKQYYFMWALHRNTVGTNKDY